MVGRWRASLPEVYWPSPGEKLQPEVVAEKPVANDFWRVGKLVLFVGYNPTAKNCSVFERVNGTKYGVNYQVKRVFWRIWWTTKRWDEHTALPFFGAGGVSTYFYD